MSGPFGVKVRAWPGPDIMAYAIEIAEATGTTLWVLMQRPAQSDVPLYIVLPSSFDEESPELHDWKAVAAVHCDGVVRVYNGGPEGYTPPKPQIEED